MSLFNKLLKTFRYECDCCDYKSVFSEEFCYDSRDGKKYVNLHGTNIDLTDYITSSKSGIVMDELDKIITKEKHNKQLGDIAITTRDAYYCNHGVQNGTPTVVIMAKNKQCRNRYEWFNDSMYKLILSTAYLLYGIKLYDDWIELNKSSNNSTKILYMPSVPMLLDGVSKKPLDKLYFINILIVSLPKKSQISDTERVSNNDAIKFVISEVLDACIKLDANNIILNPFGYKTLAKKIYNTADAWALALKSQRVVKNMNKITLCCEDDDEKIILSNTISSTVQ